MDRYMCHSKKEQAMQTQQENQTYLLPFQHHPALELFDLGLEHTPN
jgi:hypothetical protein